MLSPGPRFLLSKQEGDSKDIPFCLRSGQSLRLHKVQNSTNLKKQNNEEHLEKNLNIINSMLRQVKIKPITAILKIQVEFSFFHPADDY